MYKYSDYMKDLKNSRDLKNWEMLETNVNKLVTKENNLQWY